MVRLTVRPFMFHSNRLSRKDSMMHLQFLCIIYFMASDIWKKKDEELK